MPRQIKRNKTAAKNPAKSKLVKRAKNGALPKIHSSEVLSAEELLAVGQVVPETNEIWNKAKQPNARQQFRAQNQQKADKFRRGKFSGYGGRRAA